MLKYNILLKATYTRKLIQQKKKKQKNKKNKKKKSRRRNGNKILPSVIKKIK